jgi:hypothetical protein
MWEWRGSLLRNSSKLPEMPRLPKNAEIEIRTRAIFLEAREQSNSVHAGIFGVSSIFNFLALLAFLAILEPALQLLYT